MITNKIKREEFVQLCISYADAPDNTREKWDGFFAEYQQDWSFEIRGANKPVPPRDRLMIVTDFGSNTIAVSFWSENEIDSFNNYPNKK